MNTRDDNIYSTSDLPLAATLMTLNFPLKTVDCQIEGSRPHPIGYFGFENNDRLKEFLSDYRQRKITVVPQDFVANMRSLQAEVKNMYKNPRSGYNKYE